MPSVAKQAPLDVEIGERLHWYMWRNKISQSQLARLTSMSQPSLGRKLRGTTPWLGSELFEIVQALGQPIGWIYGECEECAVRDSNPEPADLRGNDLAAAA